MTETRHLILVSKALATLQSTSSIKSKQQKKKKVRKVLASDSDAHIFAAIAASAAAYNIYLSQLFSHICKEVRIFQSTLYSVGNKILANVRVIAQAAEKASPQCCSLLSAPRLAAAHISNLLCAIAYPHPTISSNYLWPHSFRFMFQFRCIDTCLFTRYLPLIHSFTRSYMCALHPNLRLLLMFFFAYIAPAAAAAAAHYYSHIRDLLSFHPSDDQFSSVLRVVCSFCSRKYTTLTFIFMYVFSCTLRAVIFERALSAEFASYIIRVILNVLKWN